MDILVLGGSFGGMTAAYELRRQLQPGDARIVVIAKDPRFTFIPSLPWVAMGWRKMDAISFELDKPLARKEIEFVAATVEKIDPDRRTVSAGGHEYGYDRLVIATGHRSANEAVPGLGPFDGPGHSLMSPPEAEEARTALEGLLADRGPVVIGCAPGAGCIGPADGGGSATRCRSCSSPPSRSWATSVSPGSARPASSSRERSRNATFATSPPRRSRRSPTRRSSWATASRSSRGTR